MNDLSPNPRPTGHSHARFSLASILLLTCVVAVYFAAIRTAAISTDRTAPVAIAAVLGSIVGLAVGFVLALGRRFWSPSGLLCLIVGNIAGAAAGALVVTPKALTAILPGSLVVLVFAFLVRVLSRPRRSRELANSANRTTEPLLPAGCTPTDEA